MTDVPLDRAPSGGQLISHIDLLLIGLLHRRLPRAAGLLVSSLFYFALVAAVLSSSTFHGFFADAAGYVAPNTWEYSQHLLRPFLDADDTGHPLVHAWLNAILWRWLGPQTFIANISIWVYAALALVAMHDLTGLITRRTLGADAPRWAGPAAALALFSTPLFISNVAQYVADIPHLAFLLLLLATWHRKRRGWMALWALALTFTRITGCLSVLGLGLFDLASELRTHRLARPRRILLIMFPYGVAGLAFATYLLTKLVVLDRPLTTMQQNAGLAPDGRIALEQAGLILSHTFLRPRYSFLPLTLPAAAALMVTTCRRMGRAARRQACVTTSGNGPATAAFYGAALAAVVPPALLYALHSLWPQPRWFLPNHAVIVIAGVHGLLCLMPRRRQAAAFLLAGWCALQVARWQPAWIDRSFAELPSWRAQLGVYPALSLAVVDYGRLYQELADWHHEGPPIPTAYIAGWPTSTVLDSPRAGFVREPNPVGSIDWLAGDEARQRSFIAAATHDGSSLRLLTASWDNHENQQLLAEFVLDHPEFKLEKTLSDGAGNEIRIYRYDAKPGAARSEAAALDQNHLAARFYRILLGRPIDVSALESWAWTLSDTPDRRAATRDALKGLARSEEFLEKHPSAEAQVTNLFRAMAERTPTDAELARWRSQLRAQDHGLDGLIDHLAATDAFAELIGRYIPAQ